MVSRWLLTIIVPLLAIALLSVLIIVKIVQCKRIHKQLKVNQGDDQKKRDRVATNIISIVLTYIVFLIPGVVVEFIAAYLPSVMYAGLLYQSTYYILMYSSVARILNCSINSFVFLVSSSHFRRVAYNMIRCKCSK